MTFYCTHLLPQWLVSWTSLYKPVIKPKVQGRYVLNRVLNANTVNSLAISYLGNPQYVNPWVLYHANSLAIQLPNSRVFHNEVDLS